MCGVFGFLSLVTNLAQAQCQPQIVAEKELMITDLSVVNDARATQAGGVWTFGHLIRRLTPNQVDPADFARSWLGEWLENQNVNGFRVGARPTMQQVLNDWPKSANGKIDLDRAPFRLLAIVNRIDLSTGASGEGRFVFGLLDVNGQPRQATVIFEYLLPSITSRMPTSKAWAMRWHALGSLPFGEAYNQKLAEITETFVGAPASRARDRRGPNGAMRSVSTISQVRTNEIALQAPWEMREFTLDLRGFLISSVTKQTPDEIFNTQASNAAALQQWIRNNVDAINQGVHIVPAKSLGGVGHAPIAWAQPLANDPNPKVQQARRNFALQTCTGCHSNETATAFTHISPRVATNASLISNFVRQDLVGRAKNLRDQLCVPDSRPHSTRVH